MNDKLQEQVADIITGGGCSNEHDPEVLERADEIIKLVRKNTTGEWISIYELMPDELQYVVLLSDRYWNIPEGVPDMKVAAVGYLAALRGDLYWSVFGKRAMNIDAFTHWMPLPQTEGEE